MINGETVLEMLSGYERKVGDLYREYARSYPERSEFWNRHAREEYRHGDMINGLKPLLDEGEIRFTGRFNEKAITKATEFIDNQIAAAGKGRMSHLEGCATALSIESSLLESNNFDAFSSKNDTFLAVKDDIVKETRRHRDAFQALLQSLREG